MENEFRKIKEKQSNSERKSSSTISSEDGLLSSRSTYNERFVSNGASNSRRYRTLSKQAMKDYAIKKANASSFEWFEDGEFDRFLAEMQSIDEIDRAVLDVTREPSDAITKAIAESEMSDEELMALWGKDDLGKYTINTPTIDKKQESSENKRMEIFDEKEFQEAMDEFNRLVNDGDPIKEETNAEIDRIMKQMELDW